LHNLKENNILSLRKSLEPKNEYDQLVILAGGQGVRLAPLTNVHPKPMLVVGGVPFISHLVAQAQELSFKKVLILAGYRGEAIRNYFDDLNLGISVEVEITPKEFTTFERLKAAIQKLDKEFCLIYGDNLVQMLPSEIESFFSKKKNVIKCLGYSGVGYHPYRNISLDTNGLFSKYHKTNLSLESGSLLNLGWYLLERQFLEHFSDFGGELEELIFDENANWKIEVQQITQKYYSVGDLHRISSLERFLDKNRRVIVLDRDGTINEKAESASYIVKWNDFIWREGIKDLLKSENNANSEMYIITNQPAVGRNIVSQETVDDLHAKLITDALKSGIHLKGIFCCYHGWHDNCSCRKPGIGLFLRLQDIFDVNWGTAVYIGDQDRDCLAAEALNLSYINVGNSMAALKNDLKDWHKSIKEK